MDQANDELAAPAGATVNHIEVLHHLERRHAHPVCNLNRHDAVWQALLAFVTHLEPRRCQQGRSNTLRRLKRLDQLNKPETCGT